MGIQGVFGYKIGKKVRTMVVENDAELLWQILVREIYVLMKHYGTVEKLKEAFEKIKETKIKQTPTVVQIEKLKIFSNLDAESPHTWINVLQHCQSSYINILEAGYILNNSEIKDNRAHNGYVFMIDFNKNIVTFTNHTHNHNKIEELNSATIEEIMEFESSDMPTKSLKEIVTEMYNDFTIYYEALVKEREEIEKIKKVINNAKFQGAANIEDKAQTMLNEVLWNVKKLNMERRVFYKRLKALDLIED